MFTAYQDIIERGIWPRLTMVICIIRLCWHLLEQLCSHWSLSLIIHPSALTSAGSLQAIWSWPSVFVGHCAFSLSHLQGLLRSASPLGDFCVPLRSTQETSICSPVPVWSYRELGATAIGPFCVETTHSCFSSASAVLDCHFSDFL